MTLKINPIRTPPTQAFLSVLSGGGGHTMNCGACGREHFAIDSDVFDDDEDATNVRQHIVDSSINNPDSIILHYGIDYVGYYYLDSIAFVDECQCNMLRRYEDFMNDNFAAFKSYMMAKKLALQIEIDAIGTIP